MINVLELTGKLLERYETVHGKVDNYFGVLAYWALAQAAEAGDNKEYLQKCIEYLSQYPDNFEHPYYNFEYYRVGGNGRAWLFMKGCMPESKEVLRKYAEITYNAPTGQNDILCSPLDKEKEKNLRRIWIDVVYGTTPFMLYAGLALNEEKYIDFAAKQCFEMYELFLDETCGLVHQSKGFLPNPKRISQDHWSRGNGWCLIGLSELVRYLPADSKHRAKAETYFVDLIDSLIPHQTAKGLWRQEIIEPMAWEESSGSAIFLYGIGIGMRKGLLKGDSYKKVFEKGIRALGTYCLTSDFSTYRSCPGCLSPGEGAEKGTVKSYLTERMPQKDEVHSYGCFMLAFVEAYKNGIYQVEIEGITK